MLLPVVGAFGTDESGLFKGVERLGTNKPLHFPEVDRLGLERFEYRDFLLDRWQLGDSGFFVAYLGIIGFARRLTGGFRQNAERGLGNEPGRTRIGRGHVDLAADFIAPAHRRDFYFFGRRLRRTFRNDQRLGGRNLCSLGRHVATNLAGRRLEAYGRLLSIVRNRKRALEERAVLGDTSIGKGEHTDTSGGHHDDRWC